MKRVCIAVLLLILIALPAFATTDIVIPLTFTQQDFKDMSRDLGLAISYVPLATAEPLGKVLPGFDIGVEGTVVDINTNSSYWQKVEQAPGNDNFPSTLVFPKFHVQVGLPVLPIDLGFVYANIPNTNIEYMGGEVKWSILRGGVAIPALALRGAYTKLSGVSDVDISTTSLDLSISKGFAFITPYAGYGIVWIDSTPKGTNASLLNLQKESLNETKGFVGFKLTFFPLMNMVAEADFATVNTYSLRLNVHF